MVNTSPNKTMTSLRKRKRRKTNVPCHYFLKPIIILFFSLCIYTYLNFIRKIVNNAGDMKTNYNAGNGPILSSSIVLSRPLTEELTTLNRPPACTSEQKSKILEQLTPTRCNGHYKPFHQKCSFTKATKCPIQNWITSYYEDLRKSMNNNNNINLAKDSSSSSSQFVAVYVGCNKGYDAVNTIRMGTRNSKYSKLNWHKELQETFESVCKQNEGEFPLHPNDTVVDGIVHCIEPMPTTAQNLLSSAKNLGWEETFLVTQAAISNKNGEAYFEVSNDLVGQENKGLETCKIAAKNNPESFKKYCKKVHVYTLDYYMGNIAKKKVNGYIDLLSIDVEGFDFDVMLGGQKALSKTKYLEFEYNWMGSWEKQSLSDAIKMLDSHGFTCYWAGKERLWRIDESCWLAHYDWHAWSNVACVNRHLHSDLAKRMEEIFQKTLKETGVEY